MEESFEEESAKECQTNSIMRRNAYSPYLIFAERILQTLSRSRKGFPDRLTTNLVYTDSIILDPSAGTPCPNKTYTLNGCFDPDFRWAERNRRIGISYPLSTADTKSKARR